MRKQVFGRQFKRDINQRKALFRSLMRELVLHERIRTTEAKAKSIKGEIEKHITKAKVQGDAARVHLLRDFNHDVVEKMVTDLGPRFKNRPGGYTRIIKVGRRVKDNAPMVFIEFVERSAVVVDAKPMKRNVAKKTAVKTETKEAKVDVSEPKKAEKKAPKKAEKKETKKAAKKGAAK